MSRKLFIYDGSDLTFSSLKLKDQVESYQNPVWIYKKEVITERIDWIQSWKGLGRLHYAIKANFHPEILKIMKDKNCGIDAVSLGEMKQAIKYGFVPQDIIFSGVAKSEAELTWAVENEIYQINVENQSELKKLIKITEKLNKKVNLGLRVNPEVDAGTHPGIATALKDSKFGLGFSDAIEALGMIQGQKNLILKSISFHIGSQIMNVNVFEKAIQTVKPFYAEARKNHPQLDRLDLGGGLGIDYHDADSDVDHSRWKQLEAIYTKELKDFGAFLLLEVGRFLVARSCVLISRVEVIKKTPSKNFLMLDAGMSLLMRPSLYEAFHQVLPLEKKSGAVESYTVVGPICESSDVLVSDFQFPMIEEGDLVAICDVGAYGASMSSNYNLREPALEIFI
ncbi:MAG: diaminopimelate decarboxylase [Bdellovibrio sp.]|nr:diaminopimelate decarboxylase [Bdellovibrio sp.]